jgi:hypothetical protein
MRRAKEIVLIGRQLNTDQEMVCTVPGILRHCCFGIGDGSFTEYAFAQADQRAPNQASLTLAGGCPRLRVDRPA